MTTERIKHLKNRLRKGLVICQDSQLEVLDYLEKLESVVEAAKELHHHVGNLSALNSGIHTNMAHMYLGEALQGLAHSVVPQPSKGQDDDK